VRGARETAAALLVAALLASGCGGDDGDDEGGGNETRRTETQEPRAGGRGEPVGDREAAVACFGQAGYKAKSTSPSLQAGIAKDKGYEVATVYLEPEKGVLFGIFVNFFASEAKRKEATRKLDLNFGSADVPDPDERGSAVVTYVAKPAKAAESAIDRCLG
jgi:hypothetical protein